ncbi:ABC transporter ATP-binding protein [Porphyrobacter sp. CACIAM 03H1]|uniref:ABC transporter ATP-binding protein n=1 Tax=Porphyrobacter sp. CACIAM 03H1 TaxID=2003315 RepID=UPI000B5A8138|nr:ATP-binding cassette domain-containing protein [Porphyrobacter sp. CACIAM 03H1]ASJ91936.1 ABC transporter ATP-binding protein [Porphyrobacter sp. CACIAM 03H1]
MLAIEARQLTKHLGDTVIVNMLDLSVPEGSVYGFLGPNGAGKTTTMRLLLGLLRPDSGSVRLLGHDLARERRRALSAVGAFIESASLYEHLSARENLGLTQRLLGLQPNEIDRVLEVVDLLYAGAKRVRDYSLGMKQRLALARALLGAPRLLLLDEPTNGLDPDGIIAMRALIRELPDRIGGTVFVSSHMLSEVEQTAKDVCLIRKGSIVLHGRVSELLNGDAEVEIALDQPMTALARLAAAGMRACLGDSDTIRLKCSRGDHSTAIEANRLLVSEGFAVRSIVPCKRSLEDLYRTTLTASVVDSHGTPRVAA